MKQSLPSHAGRAASTDICVASILDAISVVYCCVAGLERSPSAEPPLPEAAASSGAGRPDSRGGAQPLDAEEEARRQRARRV